MVPQGLRELSLRSANRLRASNKKIGLDYKLQRFLHGTLMDERSSHIFWNGTFSEEQRRELTAMAQTLLRRDGGDAIILAGTDLALLFNDTNTDFPCIDCAAVHLRAILKETGRSKRQGNVKEEGAGS